MGAKTLDVSIMKNDRLLFFAIATLALVAIAFMDAIPQNKLYHDFANQKNFFGLNNGADVISNLAFFLAGLSGCLVLASSRLTYAKSSWLTFFIGTILVSFGSAYYHISPNNDTLVWDRLPMTVSFMGFFSALIVIHFGHKRETLFLFIATALGLLSVVYWAIFDDLKYYYYVQGIPIISTIVFLTAYKSQRLIKRYLWLAIVLYLLAKVTEYFDLEIFQLTYGAISGHTLKHFFAAGAPLVMAMMLYQLEQASDPQTG